MDGHSEKLTPIEIKNKEFKKTLWGYSPREVVEFLDRTASTWEQVQRHEQGLLGRIEELERLLEQWRQRENDLRTIRERAEEQATKTLDTANQEGNRFLSQIEQKAQEIRKSTEEWLAQVIEEVEKTDQMRSESMSTLREQINEHYRILEKRHEKPFGEELSELLNRIKSSKREG